MLFISRHIEFDYIGVFDTDDGVEQKVTQKDIVDAVNVPGIVIQGVKTHYNPEFSMITTPEVKPYQSPDTVNPMQSKLSLLRHVDLTMWGTMVTRMVIRHKEIKEPVTIRLSDFCTSCADLILKGNMPLAHKHTVTLVLDDKVQFSGMTFLLLPYQDKLVSVGVQGVGVVFDVREMTDDAAVEKIYRAILNGDSREIASSIIDTDERKEHMIQYMRRWRKAVRS